MMATGSHNLCEWFKNKCLSLTQHKKIFILVILLILLYTGTGKQVKNYNFDYFVFSQRWLPSACIQYVELSSSSHNPRHCVLPDNYEFWAIHGLWPTRTNEIGPFFCNNSLPFDLEKLHPIESVLKLLWPNIEGGKTTDSLWEHEWSKHGTCAAQLKLLNSEFKYFNITLNLFKKYNMQDLFKANSYLPGPKQGIAVSDLINIIKSTFNKLPQIHCIQEVKIKQPYLSEIRLCFNKNLEIMDCGNIHNNNLNSEIQESNKLTNCPFDRKIILPDNADLQFSNKLYLKNVKENNSYDSLNGMLKLIKLFEWVSI